MANERMVPMLPCADIDEIAAFYGPLGFEITYRQTLPNPYLALSRGDIALHYFGIPGFRAEDSYGSCLVLVEDTEPLFEAFAGGLREQFGALPLTGFPRITRPRRRKNAGSLSGFSLVDPSGNWVRVMRVPASGDATDLGATAAEPAINGRLAEAVANAVVLADSHGDVAQAAKILRGALARAGTDDGPVELVEALAFAAELALRLDDHEAARRSLDQLDAVPLADRERSALAVALTQAAELRELL